MEIGASSRLTKFNLVQEEQSQSNNTGLSQRKDSDCEEESLVFICFCGCVLKLDFCDSYWVCMQRGSCVNRKLKTGWTLLTRVEKQVILIGARLQVRCPHMSEQNFHHTQHDVAKQIGKTLKADGKNSNKAKFLKYRLVSFLFRAA